MKCITPILTRNQIETLYDKGEIRLSNSLKMERTPPGTAILIEEINSMYNRFCGEFTKEELIAKSEERMW